MEKINNFIIQREINKANAAVYSVINDDTKSKIIIKTVNKIYPTTEDLAKLRWEFRITQNLKIPNVIKHFSIEKFDNNIGITMEDIEGESLNKIIPSADFSLKEILQIAIDIISTIGEIHNNKIIHKDINPANIIYNRENKQLRIIDFGISSILSNEEISNSNLDKLEGTLAYISPEQTGRMNRGIDYRTDFYSFGVTLYELLTKQLPFNTNDSIDMIYSHIAKVAEAPHFVNDSIPKVLSNITIKLMAKNPEERYQTVVGIKYDLQKCLDLLDKNNQIEDFSVGIFDTNIKFNISQELYGRDTEIKTLINIFDKICNGENSILYISGYSGVGKTAIINELKKKITKNNLYFIQGKYDQFNQNIAFSGITQAFTELTKKLLTEPSDKLEFWKNKILEKFENNGQVVLDIIPQLEKIIGAQKKAPILSPTESKNRLIILFSEFLKLFATKEHPLIIFLDDLQWIDLSSLSFIQSISNSNNIPYLFFIGSYRSNEVSSLSPLRMMIDDMKKTKDVCELEISPLPEKFVNSLISETLHRKENETLELSTVITKKTRGNPFFTKNLLSNLYKKGYLFFDEKTNLWSWDLEIIKNMDISSNVVDYIIKNMHKLTTQCQKTLTFAACLGNEFDLKSLKTIMKEPTKDIEKYLWESIEDNMILPINSNYKLLFSEDNPNDSELSNIRYKFRHDRVQQAAYNLNILESKSKIHLSIGKLLKESFEEGEFLENLSIIVHHLNLGKDSIINEEEKLQLATLNLLAAEKAGASTAFYTALDYSATGISLLPHNSWETNYSLTYHLKRIYADYSYQTGKFEDGEIASKDIFDNAQNKLDIATIMLFQVRHYAAIGKLKESLEIGIHCLNLLGQKIKRFPNTISLLKELTLVNINKGKKGVNELINLPVLNDPEKKIIAKLYMEMTPSAYLLGEDKLLAILFFKIIIQSLKYGNSPESAFAYSGFGLILGSSLGNFKDGYEYGKLGVDLNKKFNDEQLRCRIIHGFSNFIFHWNNNWANMESLHKEGLNSGYHSGDLLYYGYMIQHYLIWNPTLTLEEIYNSKKEYLSVLKDYHLQDSLDEVNLTLQTYQNFRDLTDNIFSLSNGDFDEKECFENIKKRNYVTGITSYYQWKGEIYLMYGEYSQAMESIKISEKTISSLLGLPNIVRICIVSFFSASGLYNSSTDKKNLWKRMKKEHEHMKKWANNLNDNFLHLQLLMEAEFARILKKDAKAILLYNKAIKNAKINGFLRDEAFSNELAANFFIEKNLDSSAIGYIYNAIYLFDRWGAKRKVEFLQNKYKHLIKDRTNSLKKITESGAVRTWDATTVNIDLNSIIKSSSTFSSEIILESLLKKMIKIVIENAGAQSCLLFTKNENSFSLTASSNSDVEEVDILQNLPIEYCDFIPKLVVNYVSRTKNSIVLADGSTDEIYCKDNYIFKNDIKSILCLPLLNKGELKGLLYLENNLTTDAFLPEKVKVLELLSTQIVISLENALLYRDLELSNSTLEDRVAERTLQLNQTNKELQAKNEELHKAQMDLELLATTDPLTGLYNRRKIIEKIQNEVIQYERGQKSFVIVIADIDYFKSFNDKYGHDCGDFVLKEISLLMQKNIRKQDIICRWGGEEFLFVLPQTDLDGGKIIIEKIRTIIENTKFNYENIKLSITLTFGLCEYQQFKNIDICISKSDEALYKGKKNGRNCVICVVD